MTGICIGLGEPPSLHNGLVDIAPTEQKSEATKHGEALAGYRDVESGAVSLSVISEQSVDVANYLIVHEQKKKIVNSSVSFL